MRNQIYVEWRGAGEPARIHHRNRVVEQWLTDSTIDALAGRPGAMFYAERLEGVWHIEDLVSSETPREFLARRRGHASPILADVLEVRSHADE